MNSQIKPSVTNPTIADVYHRIKGNQLVLRPDFQRKFVWTHSHQEQFLDTILCGYPFPEIYVCEGEVDVKRLKTSHHVIDGQQRLTTIRNYIEGDHDRPYTKIQNYEQLTDEQKQSFLSYQIVVRDIGRVDEDTVREIFRRINLTKFKLEDIEIHNAIYDGEFIQSAKRVLANTGLEQFGVFHESEFTRMADLHFVLLVMATVESGGYFAQDREVEPFVAKYNDDYPAKDHMVATLLKVFAIIIDLDLPMDSIWFRKSNFFTLVVELALHLDRCPKDLKQKLEQLGANILDSKANSNSNYSEYYSYMYQATHARKARVTRANFFRKDVLGIDPGTTHGR